MLSSTFAFKKNNLKKILIEAVAKKRIFISEKIVVTSQVDLIYFFSGAKRKKSGCGAKRKSANVCDLKRKQD